MKKGLLIGCGSVFGLFVLLGACMAVIGEDVVEDPKPPSATESSSDSEPAKEPEKKEKKEDRTVTKEEYDKLKTGMSYKEVVKIIGFEGEEMSQNEVGGTKTVMYMWQNPDGSNMNAMFQNDKLIQKSQFGLK